MFKIEKNVPLPSDKGARNKYRWADMSVGDSVFFQREHGVKWTTACSSVYLYRKAHEAEGWNYTQLKVTENGVMGVRIWRTA